MMIGGTVGQGGSMIQNPKGGAETTAEEVSIGGMREEGARGRKVRDVSIRGCLPKKLERRRLLTDRTGRRRKFRLGNLGGGSSFYGSGISGRWIFGV
jgi:hypothetical protein